MSCAAAGERPASPPHSRRPPTACAGGRLTLLSAPQRTGDEAHRWAGSGCHAWARAWLRDVSPNTDSNHYDNSRQPAESVEQRGGPIVCAQAARLFSGGGEWELAGGEHIPTLAIEPVSPIPESIALCCCVVLFLDCTSSFTTPAIHPYTHSSPRAVNNRFSYTACVSQPL